MRGAWLVLLAAGCGDDGPDLTISMAAPITQTSGSAYSVYDSLLGHTISVQFVDSAMPIEHGTTPSTGCTYTDFTMETSVRTASDDQADLVQREVLDVMTNWSLHVEACSGGQRSLIRLAAGDLEFRQAWFACYVPDASKSVDSAGFPRLVSFIGVDCDATLHDIPNDRAYLGSGYSAEFKVGPDHLP